MKRFCKRICLTEAFSVQIKAYHMTLRAPHIGIFPPLRAYPVLDAQLKGG